MFGIKSSSIRLYSLIYTKVYIHSKYSNKFHAIFSPSSHIGPFKVSIPLYTHFPWPLFLKVVVIVHFCVTNLPTRSSKPPYLVTGLDTFVVPLYPISDHSCTTASNISRKIWSHFPDPIRVSRRRYGFSVPLLPLPPSATHLSTTPEAPGKNT